MNMEAIKKDYFDNILTIQAIQKKYSLTYNAIQRLINANGWHRPKAQRPLCLTEQQIDSLKREFDSGVSSYKLAEKYGISKTHVYTLCKPKKVKLPLDVIRMNAWQDRQAGMSILDIAFKYDRSETVIYAWMSKINRQMKEGKVL